MNKYLIRAISVSASVLLVSSLLQMHWTHAAFAWVSSYAVITAMDAFGAFGPRQ